jgi:cupin fold WbuC family metalloprotein
MAEQITTIIDETLLKDLSVDASLTKRGRKNANFHASDNAPAHRLLNAMQPGSYVRPHCHLHPTKDETIIALQGRFGYLSFDPVGRICESIELNAIGPVRGINIPHGTIHTILALETDSVFFEAKAGPFLPLTTDEIAAWSPPEGTEEAHTLWLQWRAQFD